MGSDIPQYYIRSMLATMNGNDFLRDSFKEIKDFGNYSNNSLAEEIKSSIGKFEELCGKASSHYNAQSLFPDSLRNHFARPDDWYPDQKDMSEIIKFENLVQSYVRDGAADISPDDPIVRLSKSAVFKYIVANLSDIKVASPTR